MQIIRVRGVEATLDKGVWVSHDARLEAFCKLAAKEPTFDYDPDPDYGQAARVAAALGGEVLTKPRAAPAHGPGTVY